MKVTVERCGSTLSGVCLLPVRKQSKEGQPILHNNEVIIRIHEKPTEYIHATNKELNSTRCGLFSKEEVNCSLDPSSWTLNLYRKAQVAPTPRLMMPPASAESILAGQIIVLQDPNNLAFMTVTTELKQLDSVEAAEVALVPDLQAKFGNTFTSKDNAIVGTSYLWLVEKAAISSGGVINLRDDSVTLKHINSNLYMTMDESGVLVAVQGRDRAGLFEFRQSNSNGSAYAESLLLVSGYEVLFSCEGAWVGIQGNVDDKKTSSSNTTKAILSKPDSKRHIYKKFEVKSERSDAMPLIVRAFYNCERHILVSSKSLQLASSNVHVGVTATNLLRRFQAASQKFISGTANQYELHLHIQAVFSLFNNLNHFLCSPADRIKLNSSLDASSDGLKFKLLLDPVMFSDVTIRQSMMREQGLLDVLLDIIVLTESNVYDNALLVEVAKVHHFNDYKKIQAHRSHIGDKKSLLAGAKEDGVLGGDNNPQRRLSNISTLSSKQKGTALGESKMTSYEKAMYSTSELLYEQPENNDINSNSTGGAKSLSHTIAARCLHCLLKCIEGNSANRLYISDHILIILSQIKKKQNLAVLCLQELLHNNLSILQTKIRRQEIDILIEIMQDMPMDSNILRLIQRTLTSPGGVDATQRMVTYALFGRPTTVPHAGRVKADSNEAITSTRDQRKNSNFMRKAVAKSTHMRSSPDFELEQPDAGSKSAGESNGITTKPQQQQQLIIKIHLDKSKLTPSEWHNSDIYTPSSGSKGDDFSQELMDHTLYNALHSKGLPEVWISWDTAKAEYSMLNLFGCHEKVPLTLICDEWKAAELDKAAERLVRRSQRPKSPGKFTRKSASTATSTSGNKRLIGEGRRHMYLPRDDATNSSTQAMAQSNVPLPKLNSILRKQVGDYFITQLYVIADLCLDRNYVAIGIVQRQFTYEALLTILKIDGIPNEFKAAACRLLRCLFIDREPQTKANFPRYIRSIVKKENTSATGSSEVSTEIFGNNYPFKFSLLQQLISEYLQKGLDTTALDALSTEMTALLEMLFHFGFYINPPQIQVVLLPLNNLLESYQNNSSKNVEVVATSNTKDSIKRKRMYPISWFKSTFRWICGKSVLYERIFPRDEIQEEESDDNFHIENVQSWESQWLDVTETLTYMSITIGIVFAAVAVAFLQLFLTNASSDTDDTLYAVDLLTTAIFAADVSLRLYCYVRVNRRIFSFWADIFNIIDTALVLVDMILLGVGGDNSYSNAGRASRTLKIIRLLRLLRLAKLIRAARLVREMRRKARELLNWKLPNRYKEIVANTEMGKTIVNALRIHAMIFDRLQDGHLELIVEAFKLYSKIGQKLSPIEAMEKLLSSLPDSNDLARSLAQIINARDAIPRHAQSKHSESKEKTIVIGSHFHQTLLDLIMYEDQSLALQSLHLLMRYDSQASVLFDIAERTQLVGSFKVEGVFKNLRNILKQLRRLAEMFEIWFSLESEEDIESCEEMTAALCRLRAAIVVRNDDKSLDIRALFKADEEVQMLLRNLDAFSLLVEVEKVVFDGGRSEIKPPLLKILQLCNEVACWFCKNCPENQAVAYTHLAWFVSRADDKIGSTRVVRAILEGNKDLIKRCPRQYIAEFAQKILYNGQDPVYLDMYVGLTELSEICDSRVPAVETELSTVLTSREWRQHVLLWCSDCQPESEAYNRRKEQMVTAQQHATVAPGQHTLELDTSVDILYVESVFTTYKEISLPPELRYHIKILTILAHCNLGPKLNAIYQVKDLLFAILDSSTIQPVRKALGYLLLEIMKTQAGIEKVEKCHYFWKFLQSTVSYYERLCSELSNQSLNKDPLIRLERGEWLDLTLSIIVSFFDSFDPANLSETLESQTSGKSSTNNSILRDVNFHSLMKNLRKLIKRLSEFSSVKVGETLSQILSIVLVCLQQYMEDEKDEDMMDGIGSSSSGIDEEGELIDDKDLKPDGQTATDEAAGSSSEPALAELKLIKASRHRTSILQEDTQQIYFKNKFLFFIGKIKIAANAVDMRFPIVSILSGIPLISQESHSDLRFEPLIEKLTRLIFAQIERSDTHRVISSEGCKVSLWLLHVFEQMIEKASGVSTADAFSSMVDEDRKAITTKSGDASSVHIDTLRSVFAKNDVVSLCLDLMAPGIDDDLSLAAMKVLIALLRTNDGSGVVQMTVYKYLKDRDSYMFFEFLRDMIDGLKLWASKVEDDFIPFLTPVTTYSSPLSSLSTALEAVPKTGVVALDILQLLCEGSGYHCIGIKNIIREQTGNARIVPLLESLAAFLGVLSKNCTLGESSEVFNIVNMKLLLAGFQTVIRMAQGPCVGNQEMFILHTELLVSINRVIRSIRVHPPKLRRTDTSVDAISGVSRPRSRSELELKSGSRRNSASSVRLFRSGASATETESGAYLRWVMYMFEQGHVHLEKVKEALVDVIESITEAQNRSSSLVMERVITTIDLSMMHTLILPTELEYLMQKERDKESSSNSASTGTSALRNDRQTKTATSRKYMALSRNLGDNFGREMTMELARGDIVSVEIRWNNANQTIYFPIPDIVNYLSHESRDQVLSEISLHAQASQEQQLQAFCTAAHALFEECAHQQFLHSYGLAELWMAKYYLTRAMFVNAIIMNCLVLAYFGTVSDGSIQIAGNTDSFSRRSLSSSSSSSSSISSPHSDVLYMQPDANTIVFAMNCAQIFLAACTVVILFITRVPIAFFSKLSAVRRNGRSVGGEHDDLSEGEATVDSFSYVYVRQLLWAALQTATDPLPLWYVIYLCNAVLALLFDRLFLSVLLLDWVMLDSTTLDLLKAILNPVQQLAATLLIIVIIVNIFAAIIFVYFLEDFDGGFTVNTLWDTLKASIFYGFRGEYGIDHEMVKTLGTRLIVDVAFYIIVLAILRQIFFAIIVDTFSKLREEKFERELEANNKCFVCGIDRLALDKFTGPTHGDQAVPAGIDSMAVIVDSSIDSGSDTRSFGHHRNVIHNVNHYLYLILKIWAQPRTRDNGLEMYLRRCLRGGDVSWFPVAVADHKISHLQEDGPSSTHVTNGQHGIPSYGPTADSHHQNSRRDRTESSSSLPPQLDNQQLQQSAYPNTSASQLREFDPTQPSPSSSPPPSPDVFVSGGVAHALNNIEQQLRMLATPSLRAQLSFLPSSSASPIAPARGVMSYVDATIATPSSLPTAVPVTQVNYCYIREDVLQQLTESIDSAGRALEMMDHRIKSLEEKLVAKKNKTTFVSAIHSSASAEGSPISDELKI